MIYQLMFDMNSIDDSINKGTNTIYAEKSNMDKIEYYKTYEIRFKVPNNEYIYKEHG